MMDIKALGIVDNYILKHLDNLVILADLYQCKVDDMLVCEHF